MWDRRQRWEAILLEKVAVIVQQRLNDPRLGFITITKTKLSQDKRLCEIFYTVLGTDSQRRRSERALADAAPRVQELLAPTLRMRTLPELRFVYDEAIAKESRVLTLIEEVAEERREREALLGPEADGESAPEADGTDDPGPSPAPETSHEPSAAPPSDTPSEGRRPEGDAPSP